MNRVLALLGHLGNPEVMTIFCRLLAMLTDSGKGQYIYKGIIAGMQRREYGAAKLTLPQHHRCHPADLVLQHLGKRLLESQSPTQAVAKPLL